MEISFQWLLAMMCYWFCYSLGIGPVISPEQCIGYASGLFNSGQIEMFTGGGTSHNVVEFSRKQTKTSSTMFVQLQAVGQHN